MSDPSTLSRRERQIMDILFNKGEASVNQIQQTLPDPPTPMAVRRMLHILEEKGHLKRRKQGREVIYRPSKDARKAGAGALKHVLETFFGGSLEDALTAHLVDDANTLTEAERKRLLSLIEQARGEGR